MPAMAVDTRTRKPLLVVLHEAIRWARNEGIPIAPDLHGVVCVSQQHKHWERDPAAPSVDPIGALILVTQPPSVDLYLAAQMALDDVGPAFVGGLEDGIMGTAPNSIQIGMASRALYLEGLQLGAWLRRELVDKVCPRHGRFPATEDVCPICYESEGHAATDDDVERTP